MIVRDAALEDADALAAIYGHHVLHGLGTFEEVPPSAEAMAARVAAVNGVGLPYLVAEAGGQVIGFAYAGPFRTRAAYRYTAEDSVYVSAAHAGQGVGKVLLRALIDRCASLGVRQLIAIVGDSDNAASIGLHRSVGFESKGVMAAVGFKHGRWVDIVFMQRSLGDGDGSVSGPGIDFGDG